MKKVLACSLAFILLLTLCSVALAEGDLIATHKNLVLIDQSAYLFAKVENAGDAPIAFDSGKLVIFDEGDEIVGTSDYVQPQIGNLVLAPGEYTYIYEWIYLDSDDITLGDYKYSVSEQNKGSDVAYITCEASFDTPDPDSWSNYMYVTITNTTETTQYDCYISASLWDANDTLLTVEQSCLDTVALHPGASATIRLYIDNDLVEYWDKNDISPVKADATAFFKN